MKLLFSAINCTLDSSNGAAISIKTFLRFLSRHGVECMSVSASVYDKPTPGTAEENLRATGALPVAEPGLPQTLWLGTDGPTHHYVEFGTAMDQKSFKLADEQTLYNRTLRILDTFKPDVLLLYGGRRYERSLLRKARERGIATVFYLVNPGYKDERNFEHVDMVFTDTQATRDLFSERFGFECKVIGKFIEKPTPPANLPAGRFVTFINPSPEKGVTLFLRIAQLAAQTLPQARFLVVESRAKLAAAERRTGLDVRPYGNVTRLGLQRDMGLVYGMTKVLIVPSLWHDSGPRVSVEALSMGIPAIVSNRGGLPELVGDGGIVIDPPAPLVAQHWLVPPLRDAIPWVEVIRQLLTNDDTYAEHSEAALRMWERHDPDLRMPGIIALLQEAIDKAKASRAA